MRWEELGEQPCSMSRTLAVVGDRWTLLILRDCFLGVRRFDASLGGLGGCPFAPGATGNVATEDLVYLLESCGLDTGIEIQALREAVALAAEATERPLGGRILTWIESQEARGKQITL